MVTRYVVTHINRDGLRELSSRQCGQYTYATLAEAERRVNAMIVNNAESVLASVYGPQAIGTFEARPCQCYDRHFDPVGIYFDVEKIGVQP